MPTFISITEMVNSPLPRDDRQRAIARGSRSTLEPHEVWHRLEDPLSMTHPRNQQIYGTYPSIWLCKRGHNFLIRQSPVYPSKRGRGGTSEKSLNWDLCLITTAWLLL